jgi:hypothetical protein
MDAKRAIMLLLTIAGVLLAMLSVVKLLESGAGLVLRSFIYEVFAAYEDWLSRLFVIFEPWIRIVIRRMNEIWALNLELRGHWKHVLIFFTIYFARDVSDTLASGRAVSAIFLTFLALPIVLVGSVGAGVLSVEPGNALNSSLVVAIPVCGLVLYDVAKLLWYIAFLREWAARKYDVSVESVENYLFRQLPIIEGLVFTVGLAIAFCGPLLPIVRGMPVPGLVVLLILIAMLSLRWIAGGAFLAIRIRQPDEALWTAIRRTGAGRLGLAMASVLVGAAVLVAADVGISTILPR